MNDNAKIQFTIKFDQIPKEVAIRLHENAVRFAKADELVAAIENDIAVRNIAGTISNIETLRDQLSFMDMVFEDCYNILVGYSKHQAKLLEKKFDDSRSSSQERDQENADDRQI